MRLMRYTVMIAMAAVLAGGGAVQLAGAQTSPAAGQIDPAAGHAPAQTRPEADFQLAEGLVALVNDIPITSFELRQRMLLLIVMTQVQPTPETLPAIQAQALNDLIEEKLQSQELVRYDFQLPSEEVDAEITQIAQSVGLTPQAYLDYMSSAGVRPETVREQIRIQTSWQILVRERYRNRTRASRNQVEQAIARISESAGRPQYLVSEIYIDAARVGGMQSAMYGAGQLVDQIIQGAPFQAVARQFSAAPSAANGGDAGWLIQGDGHPNLEPIFETLAPGQISRPIPVEGGVYVIYMRDKRAGSATSIVNLRQVMAEAGSDASEDSVRAAMERLNVLRPDLTCDNIIERSRAETGLIGGDLGESDVDDLAPQFQQIARNAEIGEVSAPVRTPLGVHLLVVCGRRLGGPQVPSFAEVENRLWGQQLGMVARRYLRDLREDAHIELKG